MYLFSILTLLSGGCYLLVIASKTGIRIGYKSFSYYYFGNRIWSVTNRFFGMGLIFLASIMLFTILSGMFLINRWLKVVTFSLLYLISLFVLTEFVACLKIFFVAKLAKPYEQKFCPTGHYQILWNYYLATSGNSLPNDFKLMRFGNTPKMGHELAKLVLAGKKVATSALVDYYPLRSEQPSQIGDGYFLLAGDGKPVAIIEITDVYYLKFSEVDEAFADAEGDGTLANWLAIHRPYYQSQLTELGQVLTSETLLEATYFKVVHRY